MAKVYFEAELKWAKVRYEDRDTGKNLPEGSDQRKKIEDSDGLYVVNCYITPETKKQMIKDGIPNKGMAAQLFKEDANGDMYWKATRQHVNPLIKDRETGEVVVQGAPQIYIETDDEGNYRDYDFDTDGLIGNGTKAVVKVSVWEGKKATLQAIKITALEKYEADEGGF